MKKIDKLKANRMGLKVRIRNFEHMKLNIEKELVKLKPKEPKLNKQQLILFNKSKKVIEKFGYRVQKNAEMAILYKERELMNVNNIIKNMKVYLKELNNAIS